MCPLSPKFQFYFKKGSSKIFLWASHLWVGRRKERVLAYVPKNDEKKNLVHKGLTYKIQQYFEPVILTGFYTSFIIIRRNIFF